MKQWIYISVMSAMLFPLFTQAQSLDSLIARAARNNAGLQGEFKQFEASLERVAQANSLPNPEFSFGYFISPVETRVGPQRARFSLGQMFPWFGTLKEKGDIATLMAEANYQDFIDSRNELVMKVEKAYYPLVETEQLIQLEEEYIALLRSSKDLATSSFSVGKGTLADAIRADITIDMAETRVALLREKFRPLESRMNALLNEPLGHLLEIEDALNIDGLQIEDMGDSLFAAHPKLLAIDKRIVAQQHKAQLAKKQGLPRFGVGLDYVLVDERSDVTVPDNGKDVIMPMVRMSIPIWRKRVKAAKKEADLNAEALGLMRTEMENSLTSRYEALRYELLNAIEMDELYDDQITKSEQLLDLLMVAYQNSGAQFEEILRTQEVILEFRKSKVKVANDYLIALAEKRYITALYDSNGSK